MFVACSHPRTTWVAAKPDRVPAEARAALAKGLVPVLYRDAPFTIASTNLVKWHDTPEMRDALEGIAVIQIGFDDLVDPPFPWHSFEKLDASGKPTGVILEPGTKDGSCSASVGECAAWVKPFARSLVR